MKVEKEDIITIEGIEYAVIDKVLYEGTDYILTNKYEKEEPTETYIVYELIDDDVLLVTDKKVLEKLAPIFSKDVKKIIDEIIIQQKYDIN